MAAGTTERPKIRVAEAVESGVEGLLRFLRRYAGTAVRVAFRPKEGIRPFLIDRRREPPRYVLPLTFLAIGVFALSLLGQTAGIVVLDWIWFEDDIGRKVTEALRKEVSLVSVVVQAIPGMAGVLLLAFSFSLIIRPWTLTCRMVITVYAYAMGAQAVFLFIAVFGLVVISTLVGSHRTSITELLGYLTLASAVIAIIAAFIGPCWFSIKSLKLRAAPVLGRRVRAKVAHAWLVMSLLFGHIVVLYGARIPNELISAARGPTTPAINSETLSFRAVGEALFVTAAITIENRDDAQLTWLTSNSDFRIQPVLANNQGKARCSEDWLALHITRIEDDEGRPRPFVAIEPSHSTWLILRAEAVMTPTLAKLIEQQDTWATSLSIRTSAGEGLQSCAFRRPDLESR